MSRVHFFDSIMSVSYPEAEICLQCKDMENTFNIYI